MALLLQSGIALSRKIFCIFSSGGVAEIRMLCGLFGCGPVCFYKEGVVQRASSVDSCPEQLTIAYFCVDLLF